MQKRALLALLLDARGFDESSDELGIEITLTPDAPPPSRSFGSASRAVTTPQSWQRRSRRGRPLRRDVGEVAAATQRRERAPSRGARAASAKTLELVPPSLGLAMAAVADEPLRERRRSARRRGAPGRTARAGGATPLKQVLASSSD